MQSFQPFLLFSTYTGYISNSCRSYHWTADEASLLVIHSKFSVQYAENTIMRKGINAKDLDKIDIFVGKSLFKIMMSYYA